MPALKKPAARPAAKPSTHPVSLLVGTKKGGFILRGDKARKTWKLHGPIHLGSSVHHVVADPRDGRTILAAAVTGHLGPTVFRSTDAGKTWKEAKHPPAFRKAPEGQKGLAVKHVFWITPGHASDPKVWYAGTSPQGLFRSDDGGVTWEGVAGFNDNPKRSHWVGGDQDGTPDGPKMHSVQVDPRDKRHLYLGMSSGGVFESKNEGRSWTSLNKGLEHFFVKDPKEAEFAPGHDPHCFVQHPAMPDRLYMQAHTGIYRLDRPGIEWKRIGRAMPKKIGDVGFPMVVHPRDPETAWVFPMDGTGVWPRTCPDGKPAVYATRDGGKSWTRHAKGLPKADAWLTVFRQAMAADTRDPVGLYFGTTTGEIWGSTDEGASWKSVARNLPHIYAVETATLPS